MLCIIAPEYASRDDERQRTADGEVGDESETDEPTTEDDPSDGELLAAGPV
jgi:hypothetical protein